MNLDQNQLAADELAFVEALDLDYGNHLVELLFELLDNVLVAVRDDGDTRNARVVCYAYREGVYIKTAAGEQSRNLRENACLVFNEN